MIDTGDHQSPVEYSEPVQQPENTPESGGHNTTRLVVGLVALAAVAYALYAWNMTPEQTAAPTPTGTIFMTLLPEDPAQDIIPNFSHAYIYDADADVLSPFFGGPSYAVHHAFSHNKQFAAFFGGNPDLSADFTQNPFRPSIYRASVNPNTLAIENAGAVSDFAAYAKHAPSISNNGAILFSALDEAPESNSVITRVNDWTIRLIDENNALSEVTSGTYPKWVDENRFVFLKNDGIYYYDFSKGEEQVLLRLQSGTITSNTKLSVSPTGRYVAWADFDAEILYIFEVMDWSAEDVRVWEPYIIPVAGFWSVFSPDEKFIAVQAVDADTIATNPNPRLEFYNLETRERYPLTVDLNDYDQQKMFVTDWR